MSELKKYQLDPDLAIGSERRFQVEGPSGLTLGTGRLVWVEGCQQMWEFTADEATEGVA